MVRYSLTIAIILLIDGQVFGQIVPRTSISGSVVDASTKQPLPSVNVFLAGTTLGTGSDVEGRFEIKNVPLGS